MNINCNFCGKTVKIKEDLYEELKTSGQIILCEECHKMSKEKQKENTKKEDLEDVDINEKYREFVGVGFNEKTKQVELMIMGKNPQLHAIAGLLDNAKKKIEFAWDQEEISKIQRAQQEQQAMAAKKAQDPANEMEKGVTQKHANDSKIGPDEDGSKVTPTKEGPTKE